MFYQLYELNHAMMSPVRAAADATKIYFQNPLNPFTHTQMGRTVAASCELLERVTRRYGKPEFGLDTTLVSGQRVDVLEEVVLRKTFCDLLHFKRDLPKGREEDPKLLIVAPMSGHFATLLRGTVEALLPDLDVYITDWEDARQVPVAEGKFDLDDYIDYIIEMLEFLGPDTHVLAVCQPSVPVYAAVARMEEQNNPCAPSTMTLMGGPIDTRVAPTAVNDLAIKKGIKWFKRNVIMDVPFPHKGFMRQVYPGFLQLSGFMGMNLDRHMVAHRDFFQHLVEGDGDSAEKHREFYDEYLAVMDMTAEFYLQTVEKVFIEHALPKGELTHHGHLVDPSHITRTAIFTVEGEKDDISGVGQTHAAHTLATKLGDEKRAHYVQPNVGHYGVFNGSRYRSEIAPRIVDFIKSHPKLGCIPVQVERERQRQLAGAAPSAKGSGEEAQTASDIKDSIILEQTEGVVDDLKQITGVGPKLENELNQAGIFHLWQVAALTPEQAQSLDEKLDGRILREGWVEQAKKLTEEG
ncbi:polyhydroxyalkanoate depolymerase [Pseudovibrio sp. SPO723]|uniref:polyhydroxyalkanoate depolymerase n=1 Tax=Nesiotobacter zosterae TaxID=392721 RepID=UPI0029C5B9C0|nr:polyhydroxyalkanoate depolymerase [Pseudovibrio sp. SPO723]MDX5595075.1 polyhydroxyalkanoate depolymerase [Pseudovibrio sp. SPO723]